MKAMLIKKIVVVVLLLTFSLSFMYVFSSCKKEADQVEQTAEETKQEGISEPAAGGTFTISLDTDPADLDGHTNFGFTGIFMIDSMNDFLWRWNEDYSELSPRIAESWNWKDALNLEVKLRQGIKFHNGKDLKAEDVKYSIERVLDPITASYLSSFFTDISEIKINDDYSLTFILKTANVSIMDRLTYVAIIPKDSGNEANFKLNPVGCGPFKFVNYESGLQAVVEKFDDYYIEGKPYVDKIVFKFIPEYNTAKNALDSGEIDAIFWPNLADYDSLVANENYIVQIVNSFAPEMVMFNTKVEPFDDKIVRKAISLGIDRNDFNNVFNRGLGEIIWSPIPPGSEFYKKSWEYEKDIDQAKELLKQAGFPDGFTTRVLAPAGVEGPLGEVLAANLKDIGITAEISVVDPAQLLENLFTKQDFDILIIGDLIGADPDVFVSKYFLPEGGSAPFIGNWDQREDEIRPLAESGRQEIDQAKRIKIYQDIYDIIAEENPLICTTWGLANPVFYRYIKGFAMDSEFRADWTSIYIEK